MGRSEGRVKVFVHIVNIIGGGACRQSAWLCPGAAVLQLGRGSRAQTAA
jgi:hypothetical protein